MRRLTLIIVILILTNGHCLAQTPRNPNSPPLAFTDKGHWLGFKAGYIASGEPFSDRWIMSGMYEFRFGKNWSLPFEATFYKRVSVIWDGIENNRYISQILALSTAMKLRIPLGRPSTNVFVQAGVGSGSMYWVFHYALGLEYGITDRVTGYLQVRQHSPNLDIDEFFFQIGINLDVTSSRLKQEYLTGK